MTKPYVIVFNGLSLDGRMDVTDAGQVLQLNLTHHEQVRSDGALWLKYKVLHLWRQLSGVLVTRRFSFVSNYPAAI